MASVGVPPDEVQKNLIDKVAQYVAKNGTEFEHMMKNKQTGNNEYGFLSPSGPYYKYYQSKVKSEQIAFKLNQQREAATQAARDQVAQSHQGQGGWNAQSQSKPHVNKWNPTLKIGGWQNPNAGNTGWGGTQSNTGKVQAWGKSGGMSTSGGSGGWKPEQHETPPTTATQMESLRDEYQTKKADYDSKIKESDGNLKEQRKSLMTDKENRVDQVIEEKLIFECSRDALKLDLNLDEFHRILRPIVKHCTKESIATGKAWILHNGSNTTTARLITRYISARVLSNSATFDMRLHTIYLINDVLHHANRKNNKTILSAFEEMIVPLWSVAKLRADKEIGERLSKLKDLWKQNAYFSQETERRFASHIVEYKQFRDDLRDRYKDEVKKAEDEFDGQFRDYEKQHNEYVAHTEEVLKDLEKNIKEKEKELKEWETKMEKKRKEEMDQMKRNQEGLENYKKELSARAELNMQGQNTNFGPMGKKWEGNDDGLVPKRKYYELPAGLMAACVPLDKEPFTEVDSTSLRLVPHIQPSKKLLNAIDDFYRPIPPHMVIKDNWIHGCLDLYYQAKSEALDKPEKQSESTDEPQDSKRPRKSRFSYSEVAAK